MAVRNLARTAGGAFNGANRARINRNVDKLQYASLEPVDLLILGQSNEQGSVGVIDKAAFPLAFESQEFPGIKVPLGTSTSVQSRGGPYAALHDAMLALGYRLNIMVGAVGGASLLTHYCGAVQTWQAQQAYYQRRAPNGRIDLGDAGDIILLGGKHFLVTKGRNRNAFNAPPFPSASGTSTYQDFVAFQQSGPLTGASPPDVSATQVGDVVVDGTIELTCLNSAFYSAGSVFNPGLTNTSDLNRNLGGVLGEGNAGLGFDPLGLLANGWEMLNRGTAPRKMVYFAQGQSDLSAGALTYQRAVMMLANFFLRRGVPVILGNTIYSAGSAGSTDANYSNQVLAVDNAVAELSGYYGNRIVRGPNLYGLMGRFGPMGGSHFTGSITGSVLTVTATTANRGTGIAVGQQVYDGQTVVGVVTSFGTYNGTTGTVNLSSPITTASKTLISSGAMMQFDAVHYNARGAVGPAFDGVQPVSKHLIDFFSNTHLLPAR